MSLHALVHLPYRSPLPSLQTVVRTTKYGFPRFIAFLAFIPRNLFEQFNRVANIYFLFVTIL
jgi:hypothetical protein